MFSEKIVLWVGYRIGYSFAQSLAVRQWHHKVENAAMQATADHHDLWAR